jgi:hypothetical protein
MHHLCEIGLCTCSTCRLWKLKLPYNITQKASLCIMHWSAHRSWVPCVLQLLYLTFAISRHDLIMPFSMLKYSMQGAYSTTECSCTIPMWKVAVKWKQPEDSGVNSKKLQFHTEKTIHSIIYKLTRPVSLLRKSEMNQNSNSFLKRNSMTLVLGFNILLKNTSGTSAPYF